MRWLKILKGKIYKIKLLKQDLIRMYNKEGLSTKKIANEFGCSPSTINIRLRDYGVKIDPNPQYKYIPKRTLENLYLKKKLSTQKIERKLHIGKTTINSKLREYGIKVRNHSEAGKCRDDFKDKYIISDSELKNLYYEKKLSPYQIAKIYDCSPSAIFHKMKRAKIPLRDLFEAIKISIPRRSRSVSKAVIKYPKKPFSGNLIEKSYLLGFAMGDLHISKRKYGTTIKMETTTTKKQQLNLINNLFKGYTPVGIFKSKLGQYQLYCNLDESFEFLLKYKCKKLPQWTIDNPIAFLSFLGGYIDAEGHFGVSKNIGVFNIGSYDKELLFEIAKNLKKFNILVEGPKLTVKKGHIDKRGVRWNNDMWNARIRKMRELYKFASIIKPYIKHKKRYNDLISVENNLLSRTYRINLKEEKIGAYPTIKGV